MQKIGFLVWNRLDDIASKETRHKLKNFYKYTIQTIEKDINRNELVLNQNAGSLIFTNTTGNQRVQLSGKDLLKPKSQIIT
mgnify:CR=1 FL=1